MGDVLRECVQRGHVGSIKLGGRVVKQWRCWTGLKGSGFETFTHIHPGSKAKEKRIYSERKFYDVNAGIGMRTVRGPYYEWGNLHAKDLLRPRRDGDANVPKLRFLPDTLPSSDPWSHFCQMRSERREEKFSNGKKSAQWVPIKEGRPNHDWDICAMLMIVMALCGALDPPGCESEDDREQHSE